MKAKYDISGMNCAACSSAVERAMHKLSVEFVSVNLLSGVMEVEYDEEKITDKDIRKAVTDAGFGIDKAKSAAEKRVFLRENAAKAEKNLLYRLILSVIFMLVLMYFSMGHMISLPLPIFAKEPFILCLIQFSLAIPVLVINRAYFIGGFKHLFSGSPNMDSLIAVGSSASILYGIFASVMIFLGNIHYVHDLYFETAAMIPTLVTVGKFLEGKSKKNTGKALDMLIDLTPKKAFILEDGKEKEIGIENLKQGDTVIVKPGQTFPCDGTILSGESYADESSLTGESRHIHKKTGDKVNAGTQNFSGSLIISADKVGDETVISGIINLVEKAAGSKAPISRLADKISLYFVPAVIGISLITFCIWMISGAGFEFSFSRGVCVLVISCPCALGLATPIAVTVASGIAAQNGILIKDAAILEELGKTDIVLFDKTGTLTKGKPSVTDIIPCNMEENEFLTLAAGIEAMSEHPLGKAITNEAEKRGISFTSPDTYEAIIGLGLAAKKGGNSYFAGNMSLLEKESIIIDNAVKKTYNELSEKGKTVIFFAENNEYLGLIALSDKPKEDSKKAIEALKTMSVESVMLTGDNEICAKAISSQIGIDTVYASVSPTQKENYVKEYQMSGKHVAMYGDGINDSPALASANTGISHSDGTDIALETSDCVLLKNDVYSLIRAIKISRETIKNIKISLFWALFYNTLGIPLAAGLFYPAFGIILNPMIGAAAMSLSSICVVLNALRLKRIKFD